MEEMVPELQDLEERGYFQKHELKQVVKKRTQFEYLLKRPAPKKADFLGYVSNPHAVNDAATNDAVWLECLRCRNMLGCNRYAEYEAKLEELRAHRKQSMGIKGQTTVGDYAIVRRIHLIYERATRKFRGDLRIWLKWLEFCRTSNSTRQTSRVSAIDRRLCSVRCIMYVSCFPYQLLIHLGQEESRLNSQFCLPR